MGHLPIRRAVFRSMTPPVCMSKHPWKIMMDLMDHSCMSGCVICVNACMEHLIHLPFLHVLY